MKTLTLEISDALHERLLDITPRGGQVEDTALGMLYHYSNVEQAGKPISDDVAGVELKKNGNGVSIKEVK